MRNGAPKPGQPHRTTPHVSIGHTRTAAPPIPVYRWMVDSEWLANNTEVASNSIWHEREIEGVSTEIGFIVKPVPPIMTSDISSSSVPATNDADVEY